eukprot:m.261676 g.261676  ORF g.261676 m.261676 type:complete len:157 (+) comp42799_c0_seq1:333-803(+)
MDLLSIVDVGLSGGILLVTVWFFFIQSPFLFKRLGRKQFVPIMMQITQLFFDTMMVLCFALLAVSATRVGMSGQTQAALASVVATTLNWGFVVPRALAAGRGSMKERSDNPDSKSATDFVIEGGSKTQTKTLHQTVVAVVFMTVGSVATHMALFLF